MLEHKYAWDVSPPTAKVNPNHIDMNYSKKI